MDLGLGDSPGLLKVSRWPRKHRSNVGLGEAGPSWWGKERHPGRWTAESQGLLGRIQCFCEEYVWVVGFKQRARPGSLRVLAEKPSYPQKAMGSHGRFEWCKEGMKIRSELSIRKVPPLS